MKKSLFGLVPFLLGSIIGFTQSNALSFDGTDKYLNIPHNPIFNVSNAFTVEAWINTSNPVARQVIAAKMFPTQDTWLFELLPSGDAVLLNLYTKTSVNSSDHYGSSVISANKWYHVAAVYDGSTVKLYVNGVLDGSSAQTGNLATNTQPVRIGAWGAAWGGGDERRFNGSIDEVRFWNVARSAAEIKASMEGNVSSSATGLIAYYKLDEGSNQTAADASVNALTATLGSAASIDSNDPTWTSSPVVRASNSLNFGGSDDFVQVPYATSLDMTNTISMEAWIKPTTNNWCNIMMKGFYGYGFALSGYSGLGSCGPEGRLVFWDQNGCGDNVFSNLTYTVGQWQHVAVTVEDIGSQLRLYFYLNGVQDGPYYSSVGALSNGGINRPLYLGEQGDCNCNFFIGELDEVRLWNTVRTPTEIQDYRNLILQGNESGLIAQYSFDIGSANGSNSGMIMAIDGSVNNNHGELQNFTLSGSSSNLTSHEMITLPVRLSYFTASQPTPSTVQLQWQTAQEINSHSFKIERSADGNSFESIGQLMAAGNSDAIRDYTFTDLNPLKGKNYYRIQQIDIDGHSVYSKVLAVTVDDGRQITLLKNPVKDHLLLNIHGASNSSWHLQIINATGQVVLTREVNVYSDSNAISIAVYNLAPGQYFLKAISGRAIGSLQFMIKR